MTAITFRMEIKKLRKSSIFLIIIGFSTVSILMGTALFSWIRQDYAEQGIYWLGLWGQSAFYYSQIFFPILVSVLVAISCRVEHQNKNWQRMKVLPVSNFRLVLGKFSVLAFFTLLAEFLFLIVFLLVGLLLKLPMENLSFYILSAFFGWVGSLSIISIQLFFSIKFSGFTTPIIIATIGAIGGMLTIFLGESIMEVYPYAQVTVGMRARALVAFTNLEIIEFVFANVFFVLLGIWLSIRQLSKMR